MPTWTLATSGNWGDAARWTGGVPNSVGALAEFRSIGTGITSHLINLGGVTRTVGQLNLASDPFVAYQLGTGTLNMQVASGNATIATISTQTENANLRVGLQSSATLQLTSNTQFIATLNSTISIGGAITGAGRLEVASQAQGVVELLGVNTTRTGQTVVSSGNLHLGATNALGSGALTVNGDTARLELNGFSQSTGALLASTAGVINSATAATLTLNQTQFGNYGGTISGAIDLVKNGSSFLYLAAQNTYTGFTTVAAGTLNLVHENAISASGRVIVNAGAFLTIESPNAGTTANVNLRALEGAGNVSITGAGNATVTITGDGGVFSGALSNARLGLIINSGFNFLTGNGNTYAGGTTINGGGALLLGNGGSTGSVGTGTVTINGSFDLFRSGDFTFANAMAGTGTLTHQLGVATLTGNNSGFTGTIFVLSGTLRTSDANSLGTGTALHVVSGATLDLVVSSGLTLHDVRSLSGGGTIQSLSTTSFHALTVIQSTDTTFSGILAGSTLALGKYGVGTLTLTGVNTMGSTVFVGFGSTVGGTLALSGAGSLEQAQFIHVAANSTFDISGITASTARIRNLEGAGGSVVLGGRTLEVTQQASSQQNLTFIGSAGTDRVEITLAAGVNTFDLSRYTLTNWTDGTDLLRLTGNDNANTLSGTAFADTILGAGGNDIIDGRGGNDALFGDSGNDTIDGGAGNDSLFGGENDDTLRGGADNDTLSGGTGNDSLDGGTGSDNLNGGSGDDLIYYDTADNFSNVFGGSDNDTLIVIGGTAPTHLNLTAQQFEFARHVVSDTGNAFTWTVVTETYNTAWLRTATDQVNDDGTRTVVSYDRAALSWSNVTDSYNAAGGRIRQNIVNDDNTYRYFFWDLANAQTWTTFDEEYTAAGVRSVQRIQNDNGTSRTFYWDATSVQTWSTFDEEYAVGGARTIQRVINDDGTNVTQTFDHNNTQSWSTITDYFNAGGQRTEQRIINDNNSYVRVFYDPTNVQPWSTRTDTYNTAGVLVSSVTVPD